MNHRQYIAAMSALGYSRAGAEDLIRLSKDASDVALRINNFVPSGDGLYEIWLSGDRDGFKVTTSFALARMTGSSLER